MSSQADDRDAAKLAEMGYNQELKRGWGLLNNFGSSFSVISIVTGSTTLFAYGLTTGGPAVMTIGWIVVSFFTMFVALGMAEITSAVPCAGGPYYWAAVLSSPKHSAFWSWVTGYFNFLGQVAVTTGITFGLAGLISTVATLDGYVPTPGRTIAIHIALLLSHALVNTFGIQLLKVLNNVSIALHSLGVFSLTVAVLAKAPSYQSAKFVFGKFYDGTAASDTDVGWGVRASPAYVAVIGILMAQFTITGYDASAHMAEETENSARNSAIGVVSSVFTSILFGFFYITSLLFCIQDFDRTVNSESGQPILQIFIDIFGIVGAKVLFSLILICVWHCGLFSLTSNSRMMYAFARDGGLPRVLTKVDKKYQSPVAAVWFAAFLALVLALPSLGSSVAFAAATSIATIGLYISYGLPILLGLMYPENFIRGPFNLGRFSRINAVIACAWVAFITIAFCLPNVNPVTQETLNYAPVAVGIVLAWVLISWFAFARKTFKGPLHQLVKDGLVDPSKVAHHLSDYPTDEYDRDTDVKKVDAAVDVRAARSPSTASASLQV